jgi:hypothetical protein
MRRFVLSLLCLSLTCAGLAAASPARAAGPFSHELKPVGGPGSGWEWPGGIGSLPYGTAITPEMIRNAALALPSVQPALQAMAAAGNVRRPDLDATYNAPGGSVAVLAFEQPGHAPTQRQPFVIVLTRADDYRYFTQILGAVIETGSDQRPVMVEAQGGNFLVRGFGANGLPTPTPQPETGSGPMNPLVWSTAYDIKVGDFPSDGTIYYATGLDPCETAAIRSFAINAGSGAFWGAVGGMRAGPAGAAWGAAIGFGAATTNWLINQDPCP